MFFTVKANWPSFCASGGRVKGTGTASCVDVLFCVLKKETSLVNKCICIKHEFPSIYCRQVTMVVVYLTGLSMAGNCIITKHKTF